MELTPNQQDALTELINIGFGRAAAALSELTGYRISLETPLVAMHRIEEIAPILEKVINIDVAGVAQLFSGPVSGNALLMLDERAAVILTQLLTDDASPSPAFDASAREIITEVGNILLNACLGAFGNLLQIHLNFAVPRLHVAPLRAVIDLVAREVAEQLRFGLMIHTRFSVQARGVIGYLVIILSITSLDRLLSELENWESRQLQS